jgi:DNA-binding transcriptional ArsR family regulator
VPANAARVFDALGDPTRRAVFQRLRSGPRSVGDLAQGMDVTRSAVSQHLKVLKGAHLVVAKAEGTRRLYAVDRRGLAELRHWVDGFWGDALDAFKHAVEAEAAKERKGR